MSDCAASQNGKLLVLRNRNEGNFIHTIYQEDLEELLLLSRELTEARKAYLIKKDAIKTALRAGAAVEPGIHTAELVSHQGGGFEIQLYTYMSLLVR